MAEPPTLSQVWHSTPLSMRERLITEVAQAKSSLSPARREALNDALRKFKADGFRDGRHAPPHLLRKLAPLRLHGPTELAVGISFLRAWLSLHEERVAVVVHALKEAEWAPGHPETLGPVLDRSCPARIIDQAIEATKAVRANDSANDIALTVQLIAQLEPIPATIETEDKLNEVSSSDRATTSTTITPPASQEEAAAPDGGGLAIFTVAPPWRDFLPEIDALAPEDPAWASFDSFIRAATAIAERAHRRRLDGWHEATARLDEVYRLHATHINYLGISLPVASSLNRHGSLQSQIDAIARVDQLLAEVAMLRAEQSHTLADDRRRQDRLRELGDELADLSERLVTAPPAEPPAAQAAEVDPPAPEARVLAQPTPGPGHSVSAIEELRPASREHTQAPPTSATNASCVPDAADGAAAGIDSGDGLANEMRATSSTRVDASTQSRNSPVPPVKPTPGKPAEYDAAASTPSTPTASPHDPIQPATDPELVQSPAPTPAEGANSAALQRKWLADGQLLRALILADATASTVDGALPSTQADGLIPSWMCWLALSCNDLGVATLPAEPAAFAQQLANLRANSASEQRFAMSWLSAALLGRGAEKALRYCQQLRPDLLRAGWWEDSALARFCRDHLIQPATRGQIINWAPLESPEALSTRLREELEKAQQHLAISPNYHNSAVKRYWHHLVGKRGPAQALLTQVRQTREPLLLPTPEALAASHPAWDGVMAAYRNNVLSRLDTFLGHLAQVQSLRELLLRRNSTQTASLNAEQAKKALESARPFLERLRHMECPSIGGFHAVLEHLSVKVMSTGAPQ